MYIFENGEVLEAHLPNESQLEQELPPEWRFRVVGDYKMFATRIQWYDERMGMRRWLDRKTLMLKLDLYSHAAQCRVLLPFAGRNASESVMSHLHNFTAHYEALYFQMLEGNKI